jgi:hypothetical protein
MTAGGRGFDVWCPQTTVGASERGWLLVDEPTLEGRANGDLRCHGKKGRARTCNEPRDGSNFERARKDTKWLQLAQIRKWGSRQLAVSALAPKREILVGPANFGCHFSFSRVPRSYFTFTNTKSLGKLA